MRFILEQLEKMKAPVLNADTVLYGGEVCGLSRYELKYVYHHLQPGTKLQLQPEETGGTAVLYRGLKLGYIPGIAAGNLKKALQRGFELSCLITEVQKQKFLPIERLTIKITA